MKAKETAQELVKLFENGLTVKDCALIALEWAEFYADEAWTTCYGCKEKCLILRK